MVDIPTASIKFDITKAEKTIAWFYSGKKQSYSYPVIYLYNVIPNGVEVHKMAINMLFKSREKWARVIINSGLGSISFRIDDEYNMNK